MNTKVSLKKPPISLAFGVGVFLAKREIKRSNKWTTILIVFVMTLTFLNLIVVSGILVGLIQGSVDANKDRYTSDIIISPFLEKTYIERSTDAVSIAKTLPGFVALTTRYVGGGTVTSNYKETLKKGETANSAGVLVAGIDPQEENIVTNLSKYVIKGEYLEAGDTDQIMIGADMLYEYTPIESPGFQTLKNVSVGSRVLLTVGDSSKEVFIKGIIKSKAGDVDMRTFMLASEARKLLDRGDFNVDEIAIQLEDENQAPKAKQYLVGSGVGEYGRVQTWEEAQPKFLEQIKMTFALLGNVIGLISLVVASITIFIVVFVNAITRRRYIGILKGIGIDRRSILVSYIIQALFYASCGIGIGLVFVFAFLKPYITANPINFPFSDGILVATASGTFMRVVILMIATVIAGLIPARIVVRQNTLDAILGR
jgi:putative ABC transport system permease protein